MIKVPSKFISTMRGIQTTSARVTIINTPYLWMVKQFATDIEPLLINRDYVKNIGLEEEDSCTCTQIDNGLIKETGKYAIFEGQGIDLDGSCLLIPDEYIQMGYMSQSRSNSNGEFVTPVEFGFLYSLGEQSKCNIVFSKMRNEYAIDFTITYEYDTGELDEFEFPIWETETINVTGNTNKIYTLENIREGQGQIKISISKWSKNNARAKICNISFGDILEYEDDKIVSLKVKKGVDLVNESIESKELELTLQDEENEYNIFNPTGLLANLNENSRCVVELGCNIDNFIYYVKMDEFILQEPKKEDNELEIVIKGIGRIQEMAESDFLFNFFNKNTLEGFCYGYNGYDYTKYMELSEELNEENEEHRTQYGDCKFIDGLRKIATAFRCNVVEDINNNLVFKRIKENSPVAEISLKNMFENPKIIKNEIPSIFKIKQYTPTVSATVETLFDANLNLSSEKDNWFKFNKEHTYGPYTMRRIFEFNGEELDVTPAGVIYYEDKALWVPDYEIATGERIVITGKPVETVETEVSYKNNSKSKTEIGIENESVENSTDAYKLFEWLISNYNKCFEYEIEIQDVFTYELGDTVELETAIYENGEQIKRNAIITSIEYEYAGALDYRVKTKGA